MHRDQPDPLHLGGDSTPEARIPTALD